MRTLAAVCVAAVLGAPFVALSAESEGGVSRVEAKTSPLHVGASFWTRYERRDNYDRLGVSRGRFLEGDWFVYRARLSLTTKAFALGGQSTAQVVLKPQADGFWGDQPGTVSAPRLGIYEGFLRLKRSDLRLDVGHFALNYGDALVIGDLRWHQTARSFDGLRVKWSDDGAWVEGFLTYLNEGLRGGLDVDPDNPLVPTGNSSSFEGDVFFAGVYSSLGGLLGPGTTLEPYVLSQIWAASNNGAARPAVQMTLGLRALQRLGALDLRLEAGVQLGRRRVATGANPEVSAWQADVEVGLKLAEGLRISVEGLYASGDDPDTADLEGWDQLFPTGHKFLGLMDVIGARTNVASGVFHAAYKAGDVALKLDVHAFVRPRTADGQDGFAGAEADLNVIYALAKGMSVRFLYGAFLPGSDHFFVNDGATPSAVDDVAHYVELQYGLQL